MSEAAVVELGVAGEGELDVAGVVVEVAEEAEGPGVSGVLAVAPGAEVGAEEGEADAEAVAGEGLVAAVGW